MASISSTQPVTGLVDAYRAELINSARLEKATERRNLATFTDELDRLGLARTAERERIRQLDQLLEEDGVRAAPTGASGTLATIASRGGTAVASLGSSSEPSSAALLGGLSQPPLLQDATESALLRLLSSNPGLDVPRTSVLLENAIAPTEESVGDDSLTGLNQDLSAPANTLDVNVFTRAFAIPAGVASPGVVIQNAITALGVVQPALSVSTQNGPATSNQDSLLAKYGIGQRASNVRAIPSNQRSRRSTELDVEPFE